METKTQKITVSTEVKGSVEKIWEYWNTPHHIMQWNQATDSWHCPKSEVDLRVGGKFSSRMEARDGSMGFEYGGKYLVVEPFSRVVSELDDKRQVDVVFEQQGSITRITETFDAESENPAEMQRDGWQAILNNFRDYAESKLKQVPVQFDVLIKATPEKVYKTMLDKNDYSAWTAVFNPTSRYEGKWEKGEKMLFIGSDEEGNEGGMVSRIKEAIPNEFISIEHLGLLEGDSEITSGPKIEGWAGALENYTFRRENGHTRLVINLDTNQEFLDYFRETWPAALDKLKSLCEA